MSYELNTSVEICPKCCASMTLKSYTLPYTLPSATNAFRAYHNLSRSDALILETRLSDPSAEYAALVEEIQRMETLLVTFKKHRAHLDYHIRQTRAYITRTPIRQLPTELLSLVFTFACTSYEPEYHKTPLSISLVCSKWRDIAMATPRLWTHIYAGPKPEARALFKYYLERCGELPISLKIDKPCIEGRPDSEDWSDASSSPYKSALPSKAHVEAMHEILSTFRRWIAVEFHVEKEDLWLLSKHTTQEGLGLPLLEELTLALKSTVYDSERLPSAFQNAPHLTRLDLNEADDNWLWRNCGLPTNISELHTNRDDLDDLSPLNPSFTDSKHGNSTLVMYPSSPWLGSDYTSARKSFLLSTSITHIVLNPERWTSSLNRFLKEASIPGLKALTILARDPADTDGREVASGLSWFNLLDAVPKLLKHSKCSLESFSLTMHGRYRAQHVCLAAPMAKTLVRALKAMPALQSLTVIEALSGPPLLAKLIPAMMNHSLIPQLEALELVWAEDRHPDDSLMTMLSSRVGDKGGTSSLSSVVLGRRNGGEFMPAVLHHLQELRKSGIRASLW